MYLVNGTWTPAELALYSPYTHRIFAATVCHFFGQSACRNAARSIKVSFGEVAVRHSEPNSMSNMGRNHPPAQQTAPPPPKKTQNARCVSGRLLS